MKQVISGAVVALVLGLSAPAFAQEARVLSPDQIRGAAIAALDSGALEDARTLALALVARDPGDPVGRGVLAQIALTSGDPAAARAEGVALWRNSADPSIRYEGARIAAFAAAQGGNFTLSQIWLRRALTVAPNDDEARRTIEDFRLVRNRNPLAVNLSFGISPSDNVNGGAQSEYNVIDGFPFVGLLSPDARALSGLVGTADIGLRYRLAGSETSLTEAVARLWTRQVWLSEEARDFIDAELDEDDPPITNQNFGQTVAEVGISHQRSLWGGIAGADLMIGKTWSAGEEYYDFVRLGLGQTQPIGENHRLRFQITGEQRWTPAGADFDQRIGLQLGWTMLAGNGDSWSFSGSLAETLSDNVNRASESWTLAVGYAPAQSLGPVRISSTFGMQVTEYPDYTILAPVPGGRQDDRLFLNVAARLPNMSYAGFSPEITVGYESIDSNVSRFSREGFSFDFALRSDF